MDDFHLFYLLAAYPVVVVGQLSLGTYDTHSNS
jgi:hypothetical protein